MPARFVVKLGDVRKGAGRCKEIQPHVQGMSIYLNLFPFKLDSVDIIFGVEWLSNLEEVKTFWKT